MKEALGFLVCMAAVISAMFVVATVVSWVADARERRRVRRILNEYRSNAKSTSLPPTPIDRRWLMNTIGPLWLVLALGTMGCFFLLEHCVYEIADAMRWWRYERSRS
jgi:hypothetical protein